MNTLIIRSEDVTDIALEQLIDSYVCDAIRDNVRSQSFSISYRILKVDEELLINGAITGTLGLSCVKCLEPFMFPVTIPLVLSYPAEQEEINIEPEIRELIVLNFPDHTVCSPECKGLCPSCGKNLNSCSCSCKHDEVPSPQWEALRSIANKLGGKNAKSKT
jgi:uncharacterized protein